MDKPIYKIAIKGPKKENYLFVNFKKMEIYKSSFNENEYPKREHVAFILEKNVMSHHTVCRTSLKNRNKKLK